MMDFCSFFAQFLVNVIQHNTEIYRTTQSSLIHFDRSTVTFAISIKNRCRKSHPMRIIVISEARVLTIGYPKVLKILSTFGALT